MGVFFSTYEGIANVVRVAAGKKRWIFKGIFAVIRGRKDMIIFFNDIIKIWLTCVVGGDKYCMVVGFLVLVEESVFMWDIESFADLCFDVVSFVTGLTGKFQKFISALFKIVIGGADTANSYRKAVWD